MLKSRIGSGAFGVFIIVVWALMPASDQYAAAQSAPLLVNVANIDVVAGNADKFLAALKENGAASIKEPGCREFNISVAQKDPNHILVFTVFDNTAALDAHRKTEAYKKFRASTKGMVAKNSRAQYSSVAMNRKPM